MKTTKTHSGPVIELTKADYGWARRLPEWALETVGLCGINRHSAAGLLLAGMLVKARTEAFQEASRRCALWAPGEKNLGVKYNKGRLDCAADITELIGSSPIERPGGGVGVITGVTA